MLVGSRVWGGLGGGRGGGKGACQRRIGECCAKEHHFFLLVYRQPACDLQMSGLSAACARVCCSKQHLCLIRSVLSEAFCICEYEALCLFSFFSKLVVFNAFLMH